MSGQLTPPRTLVEAAFHQTEDGELIWSNLTDFIELDENDIRCEQRRQGLFDERSPGSLGFVLDNSGGEFSDENQASPFYPGVTHNTPARVRIQYPVTINLLTGPQSRADDVNDWEAEQGELDTTEDNPAPGASSSVLWATGVLDQTGVHVGAGAGDWGAPGDRPVHVKAGEAYSAKLQLRAEASITVSLRMAWYGLDGELISEDASSNLALTTSWQTLACTNKTAPADGMLRIGVANETLVGPVVRAISYRGGEDRTRQWQNEINLQVPDNTKAGDVALAWFRLSNKDAVLSVPTGWTFVNSWTDQRSKTVLHRRTLVTGDRNKTYRWGMDPGGRFKCRIYASVSVYEGLDQAAPIHQNNETTETVYRLTHTTPNVTTSTAGCWIVSAVFDVSSATSAWSPPGGEAVRQFGFCVKGNASTGIITDDGVAHSASTYGSKVFTSNAKTKFATMHTLALKPGTGTGPGNVNVYLGTPIVAKQSTSPTYVAAGDWHHLITAYADSWEPYWHLNQPLIAFDGTDRSKILENITVQSAVYQTITALGPIAYYQLDENADSTEAADSSVSSQPALKIESIGSGLGSGTDDPISFSSGTGPGVDAQSAVVIHPADKDNGRYLLVEHADLPVGDVTGISGLLFVASTQAGTDELTFMKVTPTTRSASTRSQFEFYGKPSAYVGVKALVTSDGSVLSIVAQKTMQVFDGATHMLSASLEITGGQAILKLFIDGELQTTTTVATTITTMSSMNAIAIASAYRNKRLLRGTYSHVALFNSLVTDDEMTEIFESATSAFSGEDVNDRFDRVMGWQDITGADVDDSNVVIGRHMPDESSVLDVLRLVAATDGGTLYIDGLDRIAFRSASTRQLEFFPALTISAGDLDSQPTATKNDALLVNDITVNRLGTGTSQRITDEDSIAQFGRHEKTIDTLLTEDIRARERAGYLRAFFSQPRTYFDEISINALLLADWSGIFAVDMWKIIRITDLPPTAPATTYDAHMEGVAWSISKDGYLVTFDISYAIPFAVTGDAARGIMGEVVVAR